MISEKLFVLRANFYVLGAIWPEGTNFKKEEEDEELLLHNKTHFPETYSAIH